MNQMEYLLSQESSILEISSMKLDKFANETAQLRDIAEREMYWTTVFNDNANELTKKQQQFMEMMGKSVTKATMSMLPFNELLKHVHYLSSKIDDKRLFGKTAMDKTLAIYKTAKQKLIVTQKEMILHLEIPLVGETFECEKLFTLKQKLQLDAEYILTNNNSYYKMTETDRQQCTAIETVDICNMRTAMYKVTNNNLCEYYIRNGSYMNCKFQATENAEKWIKLQNNAWLFSVTEKTQVNISCNNREETIYLNGTGKIQLYNECSIETKNRKIEKKCLL